ncbi:MAG TPA: NUDIX hydrolase [Bacteroidia bacterium]|nr:NUDIX hydrolase [Bacteroidia bacterium]
MSQTNLPTGYTIEKEKTVLNEALVIEQGFIQPYSAEKKFDRYKRLRVKRPDAVVVFIHNTDTDKVVLTRQFRYAISDKVSEPIPELMAGKIEKGDTALESAMRESLEETGYRLQPGQIKHLFSVFASPGYSTEKFIFYYASVLESDKIMAGGGLEEEHEFIEVLEMKYDDLMRLADENKIEDAKTLLALLYIRHHRKKC